MADIKRTDAIAGDILHEYDGIEEADNELPMWWICVFLGSIAFACVYWLVDITYHVQLSPAEALAAVVAERQQQTGQVGDEVLLALSKDPRAVAAGQQTFATTCIVCHGAKGEGNIGPNLTDSHWLHGGAPSQIFVTVRDGSPRKGMPTWGPILGSEKLKSVAAYVLTIRNTNLTGKAPQGEVYSGP